MFRFEMTKISMGVVFEWKMKNSFSEVLVFKNPSVATAQWSLIFKAPLIMIYKRRLLVVVSSSDTDIYNIYSGRFQSKITPIH